jgi:hypothetical protein
MSDLTKLVTPLVWDKHPDAGHDPECNEHYGGGQNNLAGQNEYAVYPHPCAIGYFVLDVMGNRCDEDFSSVEAAKAAAQADYTARIIAALDPEALQAVVQHEVSIFFGPDAEKNKRASWRGVMRKVKAALAEIEGEKE